MKKLIVLIVALLITSLEFSQAAYHIYTWGYGDLLRETLIALKNMLTPNSFDSAVRSIFIIGLVIAVLISTGLIGRKADPLYLLKFWFLSLFAYYAFMQIKVPDVTIEDKTTGDVYTVSNVPFGIAFPLWLFSTFEYKIAEKFDTFFSLPTGISYSSSGLGVGLSALNQAAMHKIVDPYIYQSMNYYIIDCVIPDILDGTKDTNALMNSNNLWTDLGGTNPARNTLYFTSASPNGTLVSCQDSYNYLTTALNSYVSGTALAKIGQALGGLSSTTIASVLGTASDFFTKYSTTASSFLLQSISMISLTDAYSNWAKINGISSDSISYGYSRAKEQVANSLAISGLLGRQFIPVIKGIITIIFIALIPVMLLLFLTPMGGRVFVGFLLTFIWLAMWHIGEIILNFIINVKASSFITSITDPTGTGNGIFSIQTAPVVLQSTLDYINLASSYYWLIPTVSLLIITGFSVYTMVQMASAGTSASNASAGVGAEVSTGSASVGNISMNNQSANKLNTRRTISAGSDVSYAKVYSDTFGSVKVGQVRGTGTISGLEAKVDGIKGFASHLETNAKAITTKLDSIRGISPQIDTLKGSYHSLPNGNIQLDAGSKFISKDGRTISVKDGGILRKTSDGGYVLSAGSYEIVQGMERTTVTLDKNGNVVSAKGVSESGATYEYSRGEKGGQLMLNYGGFSIYTDENGNIKNVKLAENSTISNQLGETISKQSKNLASAVEKLSKGYSWKNLSTDEKQAVITSAWNSRQSYLSSKSSDKSFVADITTSSLISTLESYSRSGKKAFLEAKEVSDRQDLSVATTGGFSIGGGKGFPKSPLELIAKAIGLKGEALIRKAWSDGEKIYAQAQDGKTYQLTLADEFKEDWKKSFSQSFANKLSEATSNSEDTAKGLKTTDRNLNQTSNEKHRVYDELKQIQDSLEYGKNKFITSSGKIDENKMPEIVQSYVSNLRKNGDSRNLDQILKEDLTPSGKNYNRFKDFVMGTILSGANSLKQEVERRIPNQANLPEEKDFKQDKTKLENAYEKMLFMNEKKIQNTKDTIKENKASIDYKADQLPQDTKAKVEKMTKEQTKPKPLVEHDSGMKEDVQSFNKDLSYEVAVENPIGKKPKLNIGSKNSEYTDKSLAIRIDRDPKFKEQVQALKTIAINGFGSKNGYDFIKENYNDKNGNTIYRYAAAYELLKEGIKDEKVKQEAVRDVMEAHKKGFLSDRDVAKLLAK